MFPMPRFPVHITPERLAEALASFEATCCERDEFGEHAIECKGRGDFPDPGLAGNYPGVGVAEILTWLPFVLEAWRADRARLAEIEGRTPPPLA